MIAVVQRVSSAAVRVDAAEVARVGAGFVVLVGVVRGDGPTEVEYLARRLLTLRVFPDEKGRMNRSIQDVDGELLLVSQFTLAADTRKGRRPSFGRAMPPAVAEPLFESLAQQIREAGAPVQTGVFGASMQVELVNDGPVTILLESKPASGGGGNEGEEGASV